MIIGILWRKRIPILWQSYLYHPLIVCFIGLTVRDMTLSTMSRRRAMHSFSVRLIFRSTRRPGCPPLQRRWSKVHCVHHTVSSFQLNTVYNFDTNIMASLYLSTNFSKYLMNILTSKTYFHQCFS